MTSWKEWKRKQPYAATLLTNSMKKNRLSHAYLFEGSKGTGKMGIAVTLAKTLFCPFLDGVEPCNKCSDCKRIISKNHPDVHFFSPEGHSIKIEQIRLLRKEFSYRGSESKRKLYIIEHADRMTQSAANSLLKFLEEPNEHETALLLTEQIQQLLPTIISRCQTITFSPLPSAEIRRMLEEQNIPKSIAYLASAITNDYESAKARCEEEWFAQARKLVIQLMEEILERHYQVLFTIHEKWIPHFKERDQLELGFHLLLLWYRDVLQLKLGKEDEMVFIQEREKLEQFHFRFTKQQVIKQMEAILEAKKRLNANVNPQLLIEQTVLKLQE